MAYFNPASDYSLGALMGGVSGDAGGGVSREQIAQAMLAQQGGQGGGAMPVGNSMMETVYQPPGGGPIQFGGGPPPGGGGGGRQQLGGGWATQGNNVYDPGGNLVGSQGLQQYGYIPGVSPPPSGGGDPFNQFGRPVGSSLSGGAAHAPGEAATNAAVTSPSAPGFTGGGFTAAGIPSGGDFTGSTFNSSVSAPNGWGGMTPSLGPPGGGLPGTRGFADTFGDRFAGENNPTTTVATNPLGYQPGGPWDPGMPQGQLVSVGRNQGTWDPQTGQPTNQQAFQAGPNPNAPGSSAQAGTTGQSGFGGLADPGGFGGFGAFGGFSPGAGGWGGGFEGSGFNSGGDYSGGYDTAAGAPG